MRTKIKTKLTALTVCICFISGILFPHSSYAGADIVRKELPKVKSDFSIPSSAGKITASGYYGSDEIVINIQDLHCHSEVQKNIYKILEFLDKKYGLEHVYLEGGSGDIDTSLLTELTESEMGRSTVDTLLESGYLNGIEYYAALNKKVKFVKGIEDERLYNRNIELLNKIMFVKPEVNEICDSLLSEMQPVKRDYGSREVRQLDRLILNFDKKRIKADKYYPRLMEMGRNSGLDMSKYPAVKSYADFIKSSDKINNERVSREFRTFFSELKNKIPYNNYLELSEKSNSFANVEDISKDLIFYAREYQICENKKLYQLKNFFKYLEFNSKVNPIEFTQEEKSLKEELYIKLGRTKYEQEVLFLYDFIPSIQGYFTANITAQELELFEEKFDRFERTWCSYFPANTAKKLAPYIEMLSEYHNNNLKRDRVFGDFIINRRSSGKTAGVSGEKALKEIGSALNSKNIKVVVTGGFHSKGLEKIFNENKVSYIVIMPKVTSKLEEAYDIYSNIIKSYSRLSRATINIKPFMGESLNESLPKVISSTFNNFHHGEIAERLKKFSAEEKRAGLYEFIQEEFINKHRVGDVIVRDWEIESFGEDKLTVTIRYKNKRSGIEREVEYEFREDGYEEKGRGENERDVKAVEKQDRAMSLFNNVFRDTKSTLYKIYTVFLAPILEESVFKVLPFIVAGALFSNPVSIASIGFVSLFSVIIFTLAHDIVDRSKRLNPYGSKRDIGYIFFSSAFTTTIFFALAAIFPGMPIIAYGTAALTHILNNAFAVSGKLNIPILEVFNIGKAQAKKEVSDNYESMISALEGMKDNIYGDLSREYWKLRDDFLADFNSILNIMKSAKDLNDEDKYIIASEQVNNLFRFALKDEIKRDNPVYSNFLADINHALGKVGENVKHSESGESVSEKLSVLMNDALIEELIVYLGKIKYPRDEEKNNILKNAIKELSDIPKDMPSVEKASKVLGIFENIFAIAIDNPDFKEDIHKILLPLSIYIDNKKNTPLFFNYLKVFDAEMEDVERRLKEDRSYYNQGKQTSLKSAMIDSFVLLYPFSVKHSLEFVKRLYKYGYIDNDEVPWTARKITKQYSGAKDYYLSIAEEGIDEKALESLQKTISLLKEIKISDNEAEKLKNESINELEYLTDKINVTTMPLVEFQFRLLLEMSLNSGSGEEALLLFDALRPVAESIIAEKGKFEDATLKILEQTSKQINIESPEFDTFVSFLGYIIAHSPAAIDTNKKSRSSLYDVAKKVYLKSVKENSQELKEKAFHTLRYISEVVPHSGEISVKMFADMGVNTETVELYTSSLRKSKIIGARFAFPEKSALIEYSADTIDMLIQAADIMDLSETIKSAYDSETENGQKTANELIDRLFLLAEDSSVNIDMRKRAAVLIGRIAGLMYPEREEKLNITKINELFRSLGMSSEISSPYSYLNATNKYSNLFNYTELIRYLPENILPNKYIALKNPIFLDVRGVTNRDNSEVGETIAEFEKFQEVLKYNVLALTASKALTKDSSLKDLDNIMTYVMKMADALGKIDEEHGRRAKVAAEEILSKAKRDGITPKFVLDQSVLDKWTEEEIEKIEGINTLINAIHQTSINDFKMKIKDVQQMSTDDVRTVKATRSNGSEEVEIIGYDLSDRKEINRDIKDFLIKLAEGHVSIDDFIFRDDLLVWTTRLFAHSVDMFFNFGESDRGMTIYYHEGSRARRNAERVKYFSEVLRRLGFKVDEDIELGSDIPGTCGLRAVLNKDTGLNDSTDLIEVAYKAIMLYKHSTNLDLELEKYYDRYSETSYIEVVNSLIEKFLAGEIWYGYAYYPNGLTAFSDGKMTDRPSTIKYWDIKDIYKNILTHLQLPLIDIKHNGNLEQWIIDKYLNTEMERAFIEGRIVFNEEGVLVPKSDEGIINNFVSTIEIDNDELLLQSRILNLVGKRRFNYRTLGFVGNYMFVSGVYKMPTGNIFVKGLMDPSTGRMKYAVTEYVNKEERRELNCKKLLDILNEDGFNLPYNHDLVGEREKEHMYKSMMSGLQIIENPEIIATSMSDGKGTYVVGKITFDRKNVGEGDILVVPYTTPDDVKAIENAKAIITTGGGILSHAAITTREFGKPAVIIPNSILSENALETGYYIQSGDIEEVNGASVKKVVEKRHALKAGDRVLLNGENGSVLLFNGLDERKLDKLQEIIDINDVEGLKSFIADNHKDSEIGKFIEYVYFQAIGEKDHNELIFALFDNSMPENVKSKLKELNEGYVKEKVQEMEEALNILESVDNVNVAYGILEKLSNKLEFIKTTESREDLEELKRRVREKQDVIKTNMKDYVREIITTAREYINKNHHTEIDIRKMFKIQQQTAVYNYFVSENESMQELVDMRLELMSVIFEVDKILREYQKNYEVKGIDREIFSFDGIFYEDINRFGSKATELATMYRRLKGRVNVAVPMGLGISTNVLGIYFNDIGKGIEYNQLSEKFEEAIKNKDAAAAKEVAKQIRDLIDESREVKGEAAAAKNKIVKKILKYLAKGIKYSVRSSGVGEDGDNRAFAGMGETKLNVKYDDIFANIEECWKSFYADRSIDYMIKSGKVVKPAVLIQEMINSEKSGVVFSRNKYGNTLIGAVYGLGEGLVSNILTPDSIVVDPATGEIIEYSVAEKISKIVPTESGTEIQPVNKGINSRLLSDANVHYISNIINILEADSGYPIDVEFAIDAKGKLWILQRRAITTLENTEASESETVQSVYVERENNIFLVAEDNADKGKPVVNIAHPDIKEPVNVYYKKNKDNVIVLSISPEYASLINREDFLRELLKRINEDQVVINELNTKLSVFSRVNSGNIGLIPFYYDGTLYMEDAVNNNSYSTPQIKEILSAA